MGQKPFFGSELDKKLDLDKGPPDHFEISVKNSSLDYSMS